MPDERMSSHRARQPRSRKPTPAERRDQRAQVDDPAAVLEAAARYLEARQRSIAEVRRHLGRMGYRPELVEATTARLEELGLLDDDAFARAWVESRDRAKPRGEHALRRELGLKGVDRALVDGVLEERREGAGAAGGSGDQGPAAADEAAAEQLLAKKMSPILRESNPRRRLQRAYALLARNGFSPDVCSTVARRLLAEAAAAADDVDATEGDPGNDPEP